MKIFSIIIIFCFVTCHSQVTKCNNDFNIRGKAKSVNENVKYSDYEMTTNYTLNEDDYVMLIEEFSIPGLIEKKEFKYENGIVQQIITTDSKGKEISNRIFQKNEKNQIEKTIINTSKKKSEIIHYYEEDSELPISGNEYDENGKIIRSWKLEYKNNLVSVYSKCNPDGEVLKQTFYTYNENNDIVEIIEKDKNGEIIYKQNSEFQYDENKNWIEQKLYDKNRILLSTSIRKINYW